MLITRDRDFGQLAFRSGRCRAGVVYLRLRGADARARLVEFRRLWPTIQTKAPGKFVVASWRGVRVRDLPPPS